VQSPGWYGWVTGSVQRDEKQIIEDKLNELYETFKYEETESINGEYPTDVK
jgi:hypothetical protein